MEGVGMIDYQVAEAKSRFSEVLKIAESGKTVRIIRGIKREPVAIITSPDNFKKKTKRKLGALQYWGEIKFADDWKMTDEELLGL
jgi:hypothetical protein